MKFSANCTAMRFRASRRLKQILLVMKLTTFLLIIAFVQASAKGYSQITLHEKNAPLEKVFKQIKQQSGYAFIYENNVIDNQKVTLDLKNVSIEDALTICFANLPLTYKFVGKAIVVQPKETSFLDNLKNKLKDAITAAAAIDVTGRIVDTNNQPLAGATIFVKGSSNSTTSDANGYFTLKDVDPNANLQISYIGFEKLEIKAKNDLGNIILTTANSKLDEVHVIAYGQTTERLSTGNISRVSAAEIEKNPIDNPLLSLQGKVPGIFVQQTNGQPGSGVKVQIQGQNSIQNGNDPLYVIDGVPYNSQLYGVSVSYNFGSPLSYINPADIESIEVLKDADATSIYGSRAANGAILITTKKGKAGKTQVSFNLQNGFARDTRRIKLLNTPQYLALRNEAYKNIGVTPSPDPASGIGYAPDLTVWDTLRQTDWQKVLLGKSAQYLDAEGSISGSSANTQFIVSGGYHRQTSIFPGDFANKSGSVHVNLTNQSDNKRLKSLFSATYTGNNNTMPSTDLTSLAVFLPPNAPALFNPDGTINWAPDATGATTWYGGEQPIAYTLSKTYNTTRNLVAGSVLSYQLLPGLDIISNLGYTNQQIDGGYTNPLSSIPPENRPFSQNSANFYNSNYNTWSIEPQIQYKRTVSKGTLEVLLGETFQQQNGRTQSFSARGFVSELNLQDIGSASTVNASSISTTYKYNAAFARINYNWADKYLINLTARRDGSSRFGSANKFHDFGAVGLAWIFSKEAFFENAQPMLSFGKLKASYGTTGNDQIGDYTNLSLYYPVGHNPYQGIKGVYPTNLPNPYLQWELTQKLNIGMDFGFAKDRIFLTANYFRNRSSNQLLGYTLPTVTGFNSITRNFPATVQNAGYELSLTTKNVQTKDFTWTTSANVTVPRNKLIAFPGLASSEYSNTLLIGQPLGIIQAYRFLGVDPATGLFSFKDNQGNVTSNPQYPGDRQVIISTLPRFYGGFENTFSYQGFELDVLLSFTKQTGVNDLIGNLPGYIGGGNQPVSFLDRWQKPGDISPNQKLLADAGNFTQASAAGLSNVAYSDASYIRLKTASLSWQLPKGWVQSVHMANCKIFMEGRNLFTITNYKGLDPENPAGFSNYGLPPLMTIVWGVKMTF
jgi:TonB-linked SusC/RagA family outer membrane protein